MASVEAATIYKDHNFNMRKKSMRKSVDKNDMTKNSDWLTNPSYKDVMDAAKNYVKESQTVVKMDTIGLNTNKSEINKIEHEMKLHNNRYNVTKTSLNGPINRSTSRESEGDEINNQDSRPKTMMCFNRRPQRSILKDRLKSKLSSRRDELTKSSKLIK